MVLFDWIFGKKAHVQSVAATRRKAPAAPDAAPAEAAQVVAPGTAIRYHPELVGKLSQEHKRLLQLFSQTQAAVRSGDVVLAAQRLDAFRVLLQGHLLTENVRLYVYLEHVLNKDSPSRQIIRSFRHEMDDIGKAVVQFLNDYRDLAQYPEFAKEFSQALDGIGKVLVERIRNEEETLFPLYAA